MKCHEIPKPMIVRRLGVHLVAVLGLVLALGTGALLAIGDGASTSFGGGGTGGDTVGSLPMMFAAPSAPELGPEKPIVCLVGTDAEVQAAVIDAYATAPDAGYVRVPLDIPNTYRFEFYGRLVLQLDRNIVQLRKIGVRTMVGTSFGGGLVQIRVNGVLRATQMLAPGSIDMRLSTLDAAGVLTQGVNWHAISLAGEHRILVMSALGDEVRIEQRE